jgi:uncharacterized protein (TIGR01777 family)
MKILITGATGFIGKVVCEALSREGHELVAITRDPVNARSLIPAPHQALKWDFSESVPPDDLQLIQDVDAVIHLAGEPILGKRWNSAIKDQLYHSRVANTRSLISLLKSHCNYFPKVFITASAIGFYGNRGDDILDEASSPGTDFLAQLCQDWEKASFDQPMNKTRQVALRIGIVLGQGGGALEQMLDPFSLALGGPLADGSQWMSWIHRDDLVEIILECLRNEKLSGPINCCAPHPVTNREFTACLTKNLNTVGLITIPKFVLKAAFGEGSCVLLSSQRINPFQLIKASYHFKYPTLESALAAILSDSYSQGYSELQKKCWLPFPIQEVFKFFSEASNLERITPPWLGFHILSQSTKDIKHGTTIDYRLKIHGIPILWRSEISSWNPPNEFTDIQLKGPYRIWKHTHRFSELGNGTLMEDRVLYQIPMGYLGKLVAGKYVKKDIFKIFTYRNTKVIDLLSERNESNFK